MDHRGQKRDWQRVFPLISNEDGAGDVMGQSLEQ